MLYFIRQIKADNLVKNHDGFPVYVHSPLALEATNIFINNRDSCHDEEALSLVRKGINPIGFEGLITAVSSDDSRAINDDNRPKVIISASGMCEAGRIKHHLKHNLWKKENTILFVGYHAPNPLGRSLLEGARKVKLFGETVQVNAEIRRLAGISGHADYTGLMNWIKAIKSPKKVFVNHGEEIAVEALAKEIRENLGLDVYAPYSGAEFDLASGQITFDAPPVAIPHKEHTEPSAVYNELISASERLYNLIKSNSGRANKDMRELTEAINKLCDEWKL